MYTVNTNHNVVELQVAAGQTILKLTTSLQRHHFNFCADANALEINSLMHSIIPQSAWELDAANVGKAIDRHLRDGLHQNKLFDLDVVTASGRTYRVDNTARNVLSPVNHFYPVAGAALWAQMSQQQYLVARALCRITKEIDKRRADGEEPNRVFGYSNIIGLQPPGINICFNNDFTGFTFLYY